MRCEWFKKQMRFYYGDTGEEGAKLYAGLGGWEIALIVLAVVLIFGVGKLSNIGGALGKSIREFREEKNKAGSTPQLTTKETKEEKNTQPEVKSEGEKKD